MDGVQLPRQGYSHFEGAVNFLPFSSQKFLVPYSFYWPWKDERLSRPWSHPVVLNTGLLDWESSALTTRPLLQKGPMGNESNNNGLYQKKFVQEKWAILGLKVPHPHNSGLALRMFKKFCRMKEANKYMKILIAFSL